MATTSKYRSLDARLIIKSLDLLVHRIEERFPGAGLANVCRDLTVLAKETSEKSRRINRTNIFLRLLIWLAILACIALLIAVAGIIFTSTKANDDLFGTLQGVDSGFNIVVLTGAILYFLSSFETRLKQRRALDAIHEFRSIVHVIDMHQLTKDPSMMGAARTSSSPDRDLTPFELARYLDYCSEMLSLTAKLAALYSERLSDPVVLEAVGDIERLTTGLSSKIWQKIAIIETIYGRDVPLPSFGESTKVPS